mgnify:CR=1 FL=1|jgi:hypothetical protein
MIEYKMIKYNPIYLLWGTSMGYIFLKTHYENQKKLKKIQENNILIDNFDNNFEFDNIF